MGITRRREGKKVIKFSVSDNFMISLVFAFPGSGAHRHGHFAFVEDRQCPSAGRKQHSPDGNCRFCPSTVFFGVPPHVQIKPRNDQLQVHFSKDV
jgi:hypothetical protein